MSYGDFKLSQLVQTFDLTLIEGSNYFASIPPATPSSQLIELIKEQVDLAVAINTEKARSELIIAPVLLEVRRQRQPHISLFSGIEFNVAPEIGLTGICDFILSKDPEQLFICAPVLMIVEAKNENLKNSFAQCIAAMIAGQIFNQQDNTPISTIYGAVTSGTIWRFLSLADKTVSIDLSEYYINKDLEQILGILLHALT